MAMNSFAVLADDVEGVDDVAPSTAARAAPAPAAAPAASKKPATAPAASSTNSNATKRNFPLSNGGGRGGRDGRRGSYNDRRGGRGGGGYRGGRDGGGRDGGGRGGRGRGGYRGGFRGRGGRSSGGYGSRDRDSNDDYHGRRGSNRDSEGWEKSRGGVTVPPTNTNEANVVVPPTGVSFEVPNGNNFGSETPAPPTEGDVAAPNGNTGDDVEDEEPEDKGPPPPADMSLDEYLAKKKAAESVSLKAGGPGRKIGEIGLQKLKKADDEKPAALSIMSAVTRKAAVAERNIKDSTHVAVADNAKNQEFFKNSGHNNRRTRGRDFRTHAHNHQGFRNDGPQDTRRSHYDRRRGGNSRSNAPNVDDTNAFPALSA